MKPAGRTPKLTSALQKLIVKTIASGVPRRVVSELVGVPQRTLREWLQHGRNNHRNKAYSALLAAVKKAEAQSIASRVKRIEAAGIGGLIERTTTVEEKADGSVIRKVVEKECPGEWTADAWMLERRYPEEFALQRKKDIEEAVRKELEKALGNARK